MDDKKDWLDRVSDSFGDAVDKLSDKVGDMIDGPSKAEEQKEVTITKNSDGSTTVHIPK